MSLSRSCGLFGISRQSIYQSESRSRSKAAELAVLKPMVSQHRRRLPRLGTQKLYHRLKPELETLGIKLGRDGLFRYLKEQKLLIRPKRGYTKTTNSKHWLKKHPNLFGHRQTRRPETVFVSDIAYVESEQGVQYLSLVTDAHSRKVMGHALGRSLKAEESVRALKLAIKNRQTHHAAIHHSDRGIQYCSAIYQECLKDNGIQPSMTDGYDCYLNALAERVNGILKQEFLLYRCQTFEELDQLIAESIESYNCLRPHTSLNMQTPEEVHKKASYQCNWLSLKTVNAF